MAIQEVEKKEAEGTAGLARKINKAAEGMILDIVQAQQYTKPVPSTVRELTANAVDAQSEKERAIEILSGAIEPDKYFIRRDGELYKDSNWDPTYYNVNSLDTENNEIELIYKEMEGVGRCDSFIVRDHGVGIGKRRLEGLFEVGFSTKRNRKDALGAFGLGAKVGLATGADYYKVTTVYNGVKYMFQVFNRKVNSLIGALNMETGKENIPRTFSNGEKEITIYGEPTTEKNFTEVEVPSLRHHKEEYILAVRTQLLYFPNVRFFIESDGRKDEIFFKPKLLYNSENLIISDVTPYSKPHVVIVKGNCDEMSVGVCYGHIEFKELELQEMNGNVGIKCPIRSVYQDDEGNEIVIQDGVDVIPSRESIRWTAATREYLKKQFQVAQDEATKLVEKELNEKDFIKWLQACRNITSYSNQNNALGRLSKIVDLNNVKPKFSEDTRICYDGVYSIFQGFKIRTNTKFLNAKELKYDVNTEPCSTIHSVNLEALVLLDGFSNKKTSLYLADQYGGSFTTIKPKTDEEIEKEVREEANFNRIKANQAGDKIKEIISIRDKIIKLHAESYNPLVYEAIEVPEEYLKNLASIEDKLQNGEGETKAARLSPEEKRKLEERLVANTYLPRYFPYYRAEGQTYKREKVEPKIKEVQDYEGKLYYCSVVDEDKMQFTLHLMHKQMERSRSSYGKSMFNTEQYSFLLVAKENRSYFNKHSHINDFFGKSVNHIVDEKIIGKHIMIDQGLVKWNTARRLNEMLKGLNFYSNFHTFDNERSLTYRKLMGYVSDNWNDLYQYRSREGMKFMENVVTYLDNLESLQNYIQEGKTQEEVFDKIKDLTFPEGVQIPGDTVSCLVIDSGLIAEAQDLMNYASSVKALFNHLPMLTTENATIPVDASILIKEVLELKGLNQ